MGLFVLRWGWYKQHICGLVLGVGMMDRSSGPQFQRLGLLLCPILEPFLAQIFSQWRLHFLDVFDREVLRAQRKRSLNQHRAWNSEQGLWGVRVMAYYCR